MALRATNNREENTPAAIFWEELSWLALLEIRGLYKSFANVVANADVNLDVEAGTTHAILGENGAGKSTLIKMISGLYRPDSGEIALDGDVQHFASPRDAILAGIGVVHQHFMLIPAMTVAENIVLGTERQGAAAIRQSRLFFNRKLAAASVQQLSESIGLPIDPRAKVETLSVGMQQRVEIVKALYRRARVLILDEPTAVLTPQETEELFTVVRKLNRDGIPVIFISHKLDEVRAVADTVTVMRAGKTVRSVPVADTTTAQLANWMVGRDVILQSSKEPVTVGERVLEVKDLCVNDDRKTEKVSGVSFAVRRGEIFGVAGIDGNGQTELVEAIVGLRKVTGGSVHLLDRDIGRLSVEARIARGIAYVPQDRQQDGLILSFSLAENMQLREVAKEPFSRREWLTKAAARARAQQLVAEFDVRPPVIDTVAGSLSGGNQQKVILAREMSRNPELLVAVQPTRGLDVGAIEGIHRYLLQLRALGRAILLVSLELDEIISLSDRIGVMHGGEMVVVLQNQNVSRESLGLAMTGKWSEKEGIS
ncbi:MAG: ABC transporter ATP-binding protein [Bacilli bacterium]